MEKYNMANEKKQEVQDAAFDEIEVLEFSLSEEEINGLIEKLNGLKKTKTNFSFQVDDRNEFIIHYAGYEEESEKKNSEENDERFYETKEE
jgi:hypothetical protein